MNVCERERGREREQEVFTAFSPKIYSNGCTASQRARGHDDVGDGVWDWKHMCICRRINKFEREWLGEERVNSQGSVATSTKPEAKGGGRGEGVPGEGINF